MSVLFCDLVGFTERADKTDPEDIQDALRAYHSAVRTELERFGGTVEKFIGDAVMAIFGAPAAHEDDADRAVRAGLAVVATLQQRRRAERGTHLPVRVGIASGEVVVSVGAWAGAGEGIAAGDVVNTAARLQALSPIDSIIVDAATRRLTRGVQYAELPAARVRGKADPVRIWKVTGARTAASEGRMSSEFVGREDELSQLRETLNRAVGQRRIEQVTIVGDPGVGKTRLLAETRARVDQSVIWRQGRCLPYGDGVAFGALGEIVKDFVGITEADEPAVVDHKLTRAVADLIEEPGERSWLARMLHPLAGSTTGNRGGTRDERFAAWRRFVVAAAERSPTVLAIEDIHWAERGLLDFLQLLRRHEARVPLLLLCTTRPELYDTMPDVGGQQVAVGALSREETRQMIERLAGASLVDAADAMFARSGGNPLFAEELVRLLRDRGQLAASGHTALSSLVPESVHILIAARLDTLPVEDKDLLHDAAVIGGDIPVAGVAAAAGRSELEVRDGLRELARRQFLRRVDDDRYTFGHDLIRDVAYAQLPRKARAVKHQAVASWLETSVGDQLAEHAEVLAHHYSVALELATARGESAEDVRQKAGKYHMLAGDYAVHLDARSAMNHYTRARRLLGENDPVRPRLLFNLGLAAQNVGNFNTAREALQGSIAAASHRGDRAAEGRAKGHLSVVLWELGDTAASHALAAESYAALRDLGPSAELVRAINQLSFTDLLAGRLEAARHWSTVQMECAQASGLKDVLGLTYNQRGMVRVALDDPVGLDDMITGVTMLQAVDAAQERSELSTFELLGVMDNFTECRWYVDGVKAALPISAEGRRIAKARGASHLYTLLVCDTAKVLFDAGHWDELLKDRFDLGLGDVVVEPYSQALIDVQATHVYTHRADLRAAEGLMESALHAAQSIGDHQVLGPALEVSALLHYARERPTAAAEAVAELADMATDSPTTRARHLPAMVRVAVAVGDVRLAERLVSGTDLRIRRHSCAHLAARAALAEASGKDSEALADYAQAAQAWLEYGHLLERGYALRGLARCARLLGDDRAHAAELTADTIFTQLGAVPLAAGEVRRDAVPPADRG